MRVLFTGHTGTIGGAERCLLDLLRALPATVDPVYAGPDGPMSAAVGGLGVRTHRLRGTAGSLKLGRGTPAAVGALAADGLAIARLARLCRADVIHANSVRAGLMGAVTERVPSAPPTVVHVHDSLPPGRAASAVAGIVCRGTTMIVANSRYVAERFAPGDASVRVVYNPIDLERFDPEGWAATDVRAALGISPDIPLMGMVAQITPWKGQVDAIRALAVVRSEIPDAQLLIGGSPQFVSQSTRYDNITYEALLRREVTHLGLEAAVHFIGERNDVPGVLRALDVALMPSWEEPFGRIAVEAMAMGTPVIATSAGGPPEYIDDGKTGYLIPPRDPAALGAVATGLLGDRVKGRRIGSAGQLAIRNRFSLAVYGDTMLAAYEAAIAR